MSPAAVRRRRFPGDAHLMSHEARQALIRKPFPITYIPPQKRWGGVQIIADDQWDMLEARRKYESSEEDSE